VLYLSEQGGYNTMSYFIDTKYLNLISHRLPLFKKKKNDLWNCRCIVCGDSHNNKNKARGYFYRKQNNLFYKCHNCMASQHFGTFLKNIDNNLYQHYVFERYASGENGPKAHTKAEEFVYQYGKTEIKTNPLDKIAVQLSALPDDNEAVQYCLMRKIPRDKFNTLYYIPSVKDVVKIAPQYTNIKTEEPRLLLPFYNETGELTGVTLRALRGEQLRYIMIKMKEDNPLIFGINNVNKEIPITVVEGPIDSLFLHNSIAVAGTGFGKIENLGLKKELITLVFDNQPRNTDVCRLVEKYIKMNYKVFIWPCGVREKDVNEYVMNHDDIQSILREYTYDGLMAQLKFTEWRNC
jgi:hypothetical protein